MLQPLYGRSIEYADNRVSLFSAQWGKCAVTGVDFLSTDEIHCHHKIPQYLGGDDRYGNLTLVLKEIHSLIHATTEQTINTYMSIVYPTQEQLEKVNELRVMAGLDKIAKGALQQNSSLGDCKNSSTN